MADGAVAEAAVRVEDHHDVGRIACQVSDAVLQRIALAAMFRIMTDNDIHSGVAGDLRRVVGAVVRDHQNAIRSRELGLGIAKRGEYSGAFVVGRDQNCRRMGPLTRGAGSGLPAAQSKTARHDLDKPDNRQECRQANDRNDDAAQHGAPLVVGLRIEPETVAESAHEFSICWARMSPRVKPELSVDFLFRAIHASLGEKLELMGFALLLEHQTRSAGQLQNRSSVERMLTIARDAFGVLEPNS
jgi:hypothetical protein